MFVLYVNRNFHEFSVSRKIQSPDTSLKRAMSRPENFLIRHDLPRITTAYRGELEHSPSRWEVLLSSRVITRFHGTTSITGILYPKLHGTGRVNIGYFTVRGVSLEITRSDIPCHVKYHLGFPYRIFHETKGSLMKFLVWKGMNVSWKGALHPMHSFPNSLRTPLITMWHKQNNQAL